MDRLLERALIILVLFKCQITFAAINRNVAANCFKEKGCFFKPPNCKPFEDCQYFMSYSADNDDTVTVELLTQIDAQEQNQWVAMGLSIDDRMGDDAVTFCIYSPNNQQPTVGLAYNPSPTRPEILNNTSSSISPIEGGKIDNTFLCRFTQRITPPPNRPDNKIRSLNEDHYIFVASGTADLNNIFSPHVMDRSSMKWPFISANRVKLTDASQYSKIQTESEKCVDGATRNRLIKAHGIMMIIGWWVFIANGILFARYFKSSWPNKKPFGLDIWFHIHRSFNTLGVLLIAAAFICIFIAACGTWIGGFDGSGWPKHAITGMTASICAFVQPFVAALRCPKHTSKRPIFDWIHRFIGLAGFCCACATIYFSRYFRVGLHYEAYGDAPLAMMIFYWAALVGVVLILESAFCFAERLKRRKVVDEIHMQGLKGEPSTEGTNFIRRPVWNALRLSLWVFFLIVAIAVTITLSCFIGINNPNQPKQTT